MKIWFDSEGKSAGKKRYFAVVEEIMVDKDGKPVGYPASSVEVEEPVVEPEVVEVAPATEVVEVAPAANDNNVAELITDVIEKVDIIIDILLANQAKQEEPAEEEVVEEEPVEEVAEEVEEAPVEEPAEEEVVEEEPVEEEIFDVSDEDVTIYTSFGDEPAEEEAVAEEPAAEVEEAPAEEETAAAEAAIVMPEAEGEAVAKAPARRSPFFAEKMMAADEVLQDRYDELKNYALRFRKLKERISKKFDSINQGRFQFVKLSVAGKTLKLYLNMDINTTDPKFHCKDMSDKKTYVTVPTLLRIKSGRAVKYAKILIDQCAEQHGMLERRKPFIVDSMALIEESLKGKEEPEVDTDTEVVDGGEE